MHQVDPPDGGQLAEALPLFQTLLQEFPNTEFNEDATAAVADIETRLDAEAAALPEPDEASNGDDADVAESPISG